MRITLLGHAGLYVETEHGSILCDPWFNPAFFASWVPFPDPSGLDLERYTSPDYLYVSHSHDDHLDRRFLAERVDKDAVVILPDFPTDDHRATFVELGFHELLPTRNREVVDLGGLRLLTNSLVAPTDGAIGDSGLAIADSTATIFDQNDSKPIDFDALAAFGPYDAHFVQFSGAIWFPMVYRVPPDEKHALGLRKRANQLARAARMVKEIDAARFVPFAGPPCFLDEALFHLNDLGTDDANIFLDQRVALEHMRGVGVDNGVLTVPGTVIELRDGDVHGHAPRVRRRAGASVRRQGAVPAGVPGADRAGHRRGEGHVAGPRGRRGAGAARLVGAAGRDLGPDLRGGERPRPAPDGG